MTIAALNAAATAVASAGTTSAGDDTTKLGLLLDAAHTHQQLVDASLERLEAHTRGLDAVVRDEIRHTFVSECAALVEEVTRASTALKRMQRLASLRTAWWSVAMITTATSAMVLVVDRLLPSSAELSALRAQRDRLSAEIKQLTDMGGRIELRRCGSEGQLCVRVDKNAPTYGAGGDYLVIKGY